MEPPSTPPPAPVRVHVVPHRIRVRFSRHTILATLVAIACHVDAPAAASALPPGLDMLRRTERAFAMTTKELGFRSGFLMFFADDAVAPPSTGNARAGFLEIPVPVEFRPTDLEWEPKLGDIARSGDMGYLTGPSSFTDRNGMPHTGVYFSIWRKAPSGLWFVVLDAGIDMPSPAPEFAVEGFRAAAASAWKSDSANVAKHAESLKKVDLELIAAARQGVAAAYRTHLSQDARMHRENTHAALGSNAILAALEKTGGTVKAEQLRVEVSQAGDLGWTFGACEATVAGETRKGAYSRVWKRDDGGRWRVVVDIFNPERK